MGQERGRRIFRARKPDPRVTAEHNRAARHAGERRRCRCRVSSCRACWSGLRSSRRCSPYHGVLRGGRGAARRRVRVCSLVAAFHVLPMLADAIGWRRLLPPELRPSVRADAVDALDRRVGERAAAGVAGRRQHREGRACSRGRGDRRRGRRARPSSSTSRWSMLTQIVFTVIGLAFLLLLHRRAPARAAGRRRAGHHGQHPGRLLRRAAPGRVRHAGADAGAGRARGVGARWSPAATRSMRRWRCSTASRARSPRRAPGI